MQNCLFLNFKEMRGFAFGSLLLLVYAFTTAFKPPATPATHRITIRLNSATSFQQHTAYVISGDARQMLIEKHINADIKYQKVVRNKAYPKALKKKVNLLALSAEAQYKIWDAVDSLYDIYSTHTVKRITVTPSKDPAYFKMIDSVYHASDEVFTPKNPRRVLDGLYYQITIKNDKQNKRYYINTPNSTLHPLLSHLMTKTGGYFK